jgi:hypothetical protein
VAKKRGKRQRIRKALLLISLLSFPVIINYLSPYVIIDGAMNGVVNGSFIVFVALFVSSLLVGRLWCGWLCPGAGLGEACTAVNDKPARGGKWNWIKWAIWFIWIGLIAFLAISAGGYKRVNFFHLTESGISVDRPQGYIIYYAVLGIFIALSWIAGKRAGCLPHHLLDGAVHDPWAQDQEPVQMAGAAAKGRTGQVYRLQALHQSLPDGPRRQRNGAEWRDGKQRVRPVRELRRCLPQGCDPLLLQCGEVKAEIRHVKALAAPCPDSGCSADQAPA